MNEPIKHAVNPTTPTEADALLHADALVGGASEDGPIDYGDRGRRWNLKRKNRFVRLPDPPSDENPYEMSWREHAVRLILAGESDVVMEEMDSSGVAELLPKGASGTTGGKGFPDSSEFWRNDGGAIER